MSYSHHAYGPSGVRIYENSDRMTEDFGSLFTEDRSVRGTITNMGTYGNSWRVLLEGDRDSRWVGKSDVAPNRRAAEQMLVRMMDEAWRLGHPGAR
jgi:hypothetical protein